jgi:branched-chain amino acid transport system ATP-binding protein
MAIDALLSIKNVNVHYASSHVLHDVSLEVGKSPLGLLGRNGMGKTTLCSAIMGLTPISGGEVWFKGQNISDAAPEIRAGLGMGYVPQGRRIFRSLSVEEHLKMMEEKGGSWTLQRVYDLFPRLAERRQNLGDRLSGGEQQMLAISRALLTNPDLLILDEPTEGLAPAIVSDVIELLVQLSRDGMSIFLVEQNLHAALESVKDVAIMVGGELADILPAEQLEKDSSLQKKHLGLEPGQDIQKETGNE